jgi:hypothetical protein
MGWVSSPRELRFNGVLRSSSAFFVLWGTYITLTQEYAADLIWGPALQKQG